MVNSSLFNIHGQLIRMEYPAIMGIINLSQNSFYAGSIINSELEITSKVEKYLIEGVDIIDLGAASTRPGSKIVDPQTEQNLLIPAFKAIQKISSKLIISIDTLHSETARVLLDLGAHMINDVSCSEFDPKMLDVLSDFQVPYIGMHMRGIPETMMKSEYLVYDNLVADIIQYFSKKKFELMNRNIHQFIIDPGFGFSKSLTQNYELLSELNLFHILDCPILVGLSRKSMIAKLLNVEASEALYGTLAAETIALLNGANILRVHDVKPAKEIIKIYKAFQKSKTYLDT